MEMMYTIIANNNNHSPNLKSIKSALDVQPEALASQLTLIDLPIFKAIRRDELSSLGSWTGGKKQEISPNVVAINRQFNQVTFWVVGQVLSYNSARGRADAIHHFIRVAKKLFKLNNLHSCYAIVSALFSTPIFRLYKTWHYVNKKYFKDKQHLDRLMALFSDESNFESLRRHLHTCSLPCIPYLGMYSRDLIYVGVAHSQGTTQRTKKMDTVISAIERFQESTYDNLVLIDHVYQYLLSCRYIDELQKFVEDENYRKSLTLEPILI